MPYEGSADIDGEGFVEDEEGFEESTSENEPDIENSSTSDEDAGKNEEVVEETTEKGTKLARDPLQQANQLRANAEAKSRQYEDLLMDPVGLERYLEDLKTSTGYKGKATSGATDVSKETKEMLRVDPDRIETVEDLRNFAKMLQQNITEEVGNVRKTVGGLVAGQRVNATVQKVSGGIETVRSKYPELREKNPDGTPNPSFNPVFDQKLSELYERYDLDPRTRMFKGEVDIVRLADDLAEVMSIGKDKGSRDAQTIVKDRRSGRISQGGSDSSSSVDESKMSPSQIIASRIKRSRVSGRRR